MPKCRENRRAKAKRSKLAKARWVSLKEDGLHYIDGNIVMQLPPGLRSKRDNSRYRISISRSGRRVVQTVERLNVTLGRFEPVLCREFEISKKLPIAVRRARMAAFEQSVLLHQALPEDSPESSQ
jgi:hypothetical protein